MVFILNKIQKQVQQLAPHHRVQPGGGLVQHQQRGMVGQRSGKAQFHPHTAAEFLHPFVAGEGKPVQIAVKGRSIPPGAKHPRQRTAHLPPGEVLVEISVLEHNAQLGPCADVLRRTAQQRDGAAVRAVDAAQHFEQRGFARAVFPYKPHDAARGNFQIYRTQRKIRVLLHNAAQSGRQFAHTCSSHKSRSVSHTSS